MAPKQMPMVRTAALQSDIWVIWQVKRLVKHVAERRTLALARSASSGWSRVHELRRNRKLQDAQIFSQQQQPNTSKPMSSTPGISLRKQHTLPEQ